ncbi:MAG: sulfotransferase [Sedimentitalea sp.]
MMRKALKRVLGPTVARLSPQCRFERAVFVISHMRSGSTALSNVLCSHPKISGYGEAHIAYRSQSDLGQLLLNQTKRRAYSLRAPHLFDKLLHNRHDSHLPPDFFGARAVFLLRQPDFAIPSITRLFRTLNSDEYCDDTQAAQYYLTRVTQIGDLWRQFSPVRRIGLCSETLLCDPDRALARVQAMLDLEPALQNRYDSPRASLKPGAGDPTRSGAHSQIIAQPVPEPPKLQVPRDLMAQCRAAHRGLSDAFD